MRDWMRDKLMKRRSKRGPNESESTGKIGQEIPTDQPAPIRPSYPEPIASSEAAPAETVAAQPDVAAEMHGFEPGEVRSAAEPEQEPELPVEGTLPLDPEPREPLLPELPVVPVSVSD